MSHYQSGTDKAGGVIQAMLPPRMRHDSEHKDHEEKQPHKSDGADASTPQITIHIPENLQKGGSQLQKSDLDWLTPSFIKKAAVATGAFLATRFGANYWLNSQLLPFDQEVARLTREDIMQRAGAGLSNIGVGADAGGIGGHAIEEAHSLNLIRSGKHPLAEFSYKVGGRAVIASGVGLAAGATAWTLAKGAPEKQGASFQERVKAPKDSAEADISR